MKIKHDGELPGRGVIELGFIQTEGEVEFFVKNEVFESDRGVVDDWKGEVDLVAAEDGAVAVELEDPHAVFHYMWERTH